jgi:hypothetical protein
MTNRCGRSASIAAQFSIPQVTSNEFDVQSVLARMADRATEPDLGALALSRVTRETAGKIGRGRVLGVAQRSYLGPLDRRLTVPLTTGPLNYFPTGRCECSRVRIHRMRLQAPECVECLRKFPGDLERLRATTLYLG